ncbi:pyridoxamine 5'-phosphate oxidase family protein [Xenorhabdus bharatensis]|uniref:pyridoxamine 5'-phosphate oxidase family protein n=1 Tax=Xenorhabdus bharatensis TaxID=3136256 RepID=UPI0030F44D9A
MNKYIQSSFDLLSNIRFFGLSTYDPDTKSTWSSTLFYIPKYNPLSLIWYSKQDTRHSQGVSINPQVSGTIYSSITMPDSSLVLAGSQFTGHAHQVPDSKLQETYDYFFLQTHPDEDIRKQKSPPISDFHGDAIRRFYEFNVEAWWVYDLTLWSEHQDDARISISLNDLLYPPKN